MNIYVVAADMDYGTLISDASDEFNRKWQFDIAGHHCTEWDVPNLVRPPNARSPAILSVDCLFSFVPGRGLILADNAKTDLENLLEPCGQLLPVTVEKKSGYWWFNCLTEIHEALDFSSMLVERNERRPDIIRTVKQWAFHANVVATAPAVFCVGGTSAASSYLFATDAMVQL